MPASSTTKAPSPIQLEIAGIPLSVQSDSPFHRKWIRLGYRKFLTRKPPELQLFIQTKRWNSLLPVFRERISWQGTLWSLEAQNFRVRETEAGKSYVAEMEPEGGHGDLLRTWFSFVLLRRGGLLLHAAGVVRKGAALVFCGPSGSGKTTLARLAAPQPVLSDESVAILPGDIGGPAGRGFDAFATPFFGELHQIAENAQAPIREILLISPTRFASGNISFRILPVPPAEATALLLSQTFLRRLSRYWLDLILPLLEELVMNVTVRRLEFRPSQEIWRFIDDQSG